MAETTALVLTATIAYLALYQDQQEKTYQEITSAIPSNRDPVCVQPSIFREIITRYMQNLDDLSKLTHTLACFNETLRLLRKYSSFWW
jgi:cytochrome P450